MATLLVDDRQLSFGVVTVEPSQRGIALNGGNARGFLGKRLLRLTIETLRTRLAFFGTRDFLHDADAAHRHEIPRHAPRIRPVHRKVVDAQRRDRVGKLRGGDGHLARRADGEILRNEHLRTGDRLSLGFRERERHVGDGRRALCSE